MALLNWSQIQLKFYVCTKTMEKKTRIITPLGLKAVLLTIKAYRLVFMKKKLVVINLFAFHRYSRLVCFKLCFSFEAKESGSPQDYFDRFSSRPSLILVVSDDRTTIN